MTYVRWVTIKRFCDLTGDTPDAVNSRIYKGVWPEGVIWIKDPLGRRKINLEEYDKWVESAA